MSFHSPENGATVGADQVWPRRCETMIVETALDDRAK
jgi:hypothetical protein